MICMFRLAAISLAAVLLFSGCDSAGNRPPVRKVISEKLTATEQRVSFDPWDNKNSIRSRAESVYYLIAEDGTIAEVSLKEYAKLKVGQSFESSHWK